MGSLWADSWAVLHEKDGKSNIIMILNGRYEQDGRGKKAIKKGLKRLISLKTLDFTVGRNERI